MKIPTLLKQLQQQPYETRVKMLWGATAVMALILVVLWVLSINMRIDEIENPNPIAIEQKEVVATKPKFVKVERVEESGASLKIFFSVNNTENDILNFSSDSEVKLTAKGISTTPTRMQDRQNKP